MKNTAIKKLTAINERVLNSYKSKKEIIQARSEKLDPNNPENQQKPLLKGKKGRKVRNDGFEHRSSKETTDPI